MALDAATLEMCIRDRFSGVTERVCFGQAIIFTIYGTCSSFFLLRIDGIPLNLYTICLLYTSNTGYFTVPGGSVNIMACGTAEGTQKFKVALWKKVDGGAAYVPDSTY